MAESSREELIALVAAPQVRIAELARQLGLNSSNSGKPPSSDGLRKPARGIKGLRESSCKQSGEQKRHKGETLQQVAVANDVVDHSPSACATYDAGLDAQTSATHSVRQGS